MKFKIIKQVSKEKLLHILPKAYKPMMPPEISGNVLCTVILFRYSQEDVTTSSVADKAMQQLKDTEDKIIAVAGCFTQEALAVLTQHGVEPLTLSDFEWTDKSYEEIRVSIGAKVKRPVASTLRS